MASTWAKILTEIDAQRQVPGKKVFWARVLEQKIRNVFAYTNRPLIIYGSACTVPGKKSRPEDLMIDVSDKIGFHDVIENLPGPNLDIIIHSPGGYPEAAESLVEEVRRKFSHVRCIIPLYAKSAATMMVMSGDEILLDEDAELGPIDPQMVTAGGVSPAEAIKEQFQKASAEIYSDPRKLSAWIPILQPMGPSLLVQCDDAILLSKTLVKEWLVKYMFRGQADGPTKANEVAEYLGTHSNFKSHGRRVKFEHLNNPKFGLSIKNLRTDPDLYSRVWELYCAMDIVFGNTPIYKLYYNSSNDCIVRQIPQQVELLLQQVPQPIPGQPL